MDPMSSHVRTKNHSNNNSNQDSNWNTLRSNFKNKSSHITKILKSTGNSTKKNSSRSNINLSSNTSHSTINHINISNISTVNNHSNNIDFTCSHFNLATFCDLRAQRARREKTGLALNLLLITLLLHLAAPTMAECPAHCECKWKSGKESVLCLNANLTHIPAPLDAGTQVLDLTGNEIAAIPHDTFAAAQLLNLQKVYLAKCRLRLIERFAFRKLINLVELDLSYNQLTNVPSQAFEAIPELRELRLNGNPIWRIANDAFARVPQLVRLDLSDCKVSVVEVRAFAGLEISLEWLRLDGNKLSEVRSGTITSLTNLHGIELARNQWNCSCALRPLRAWMLRENIPCGIPPLCRSPPRLATRAWDKLDLDDFACVPQIIATDTTAHGVEGRNITMSCYVEGVPEPAVRWLVKNRVIANLSATSSSAEASTSPRTAAATQGRKTYVVNMLRNASNLTILTADMQDAGIYTCAAENKAGKVEASVTLAVSRRPPDAPLGAKIVLLCVLIALLFVVGSSFAAICFCSLRRKRKMRLWNTMASAAATAAGRSESYEKIEMTTRDAGGISGGCIAGKSGANGGAALGGYACHEDNGYLRNATTPLCGSDDGIAVVNPSSAGAKRNGDYRNIPTHCDDDVVGYEENVRGQSSGGGAAVRWKGVKMRTSPQDVKRGIGGGAVEAAATSTSTGVEETDLHIPRLIDIGSNPDSASSSISSQVDAAARHAGYTHAPAAWATQNIATTKIGVSSPRNPRETPDFSVAASSGPYYGANTSSNNNDDVSTSVFCSNSPNGAENADLFDSNYPDLLDIAKYAVAQASSASAAAAAAAAGNSHYTAATTQSHATNSGLCTLPRKLKHTGKYFKHSSDSQSPLLADNSSSKYSSSTLGDAGFLNELASFGRRFSAESTYSNYPNSTLYTSGQRSNSFLNLVQSCNNNNSSSSNKSAAMSVSCSAAMSAAAAVAAQRRNPSLPSSPVHELHQHQRSFSAAATPLLDFSTLTTRSATATGAGTTLTPGNVAQLLHATPVNSLAPGEAPNANSTAYDYHAAQLERFLEEYRNLQDQLCKMKETCETIRKKETPIRGGMAQFADPVMYNAAMTASVNSPTSHPKTTMLKSKAILPGQPPDPPPYWLHRNAMLKRLNDTQTDADIFKS